MFRRESVSPGRCCQLPGCNTWANDLEDLLEDGAFSACLSDGLFAEHSGLARVVVAMCIQRRFVLACRQEALVILPATAAPGGWWGAGASSWALASAPEETLGFAGMPWVLYAGVRPGCV